MRNPGRRPGRSHAAEFAAAQLLPATLETTWKPLNTGILTAVSLELTRTVRENFPRRALIVDDEPLIRWAAASTLSAAGFSVIEAGNLAHARQEAGAGDFDLALVDVRLPDGDGVALMHEIQAAQPGCRFIMMTAFRTPELTAEAAADRVSVLDKPFGMPELASLAEQVINS
jgi:DNA-binding NtrC family response regulator